MAQSQTWLASKAFAKATFALFNPKLWGLALVPFLVSCGIWTVLGIVLWDPMFQWVSQVISQISLPVWLTHWLPGWVMTVAESSRAVWVPFTLLVLLIPAVLLTVLMLIGVMGVGYVARGVGAQYGLAPQGKSALRQSVTLLSSIWHSVWVLTLFVGIWVLTLPLWLIPGLGFLVPMLLLAWVNARLFSFDVLNEFASKQEREALLHKHRKTLLVLGFLASIPTFLPSILWVSGALVVVFLPLFAALAVWLYTLFFLSTAALFSHYLLPALRHEREQLAKVAQNYADAQAAKQAEQDAQAIEVEAKQTTPTLSLPNPSSPQELT